MPMELLPIAFCLIAAIIFFMVYIQTKRYAIAEFVDLVAKLDAMAIRVAAMEKLVEHAKDLRIIDDFQGNLRRLENVLTVFSQIDRDAQEDLQNRARLQKLIADTRQRLASNEKSLKTHLASLAIDYRGLLRWAPVEQDVAGCYFCSRPYDAPKFKCVKSRIHGVTIKVWGCSGCRATLGKKQKVKVLYIVCDGQPIHWAQVKGYQPSENFWDLNEPKQAPPALRLLFTEACQGSPDEDDIDMLKENP